MKENQKKIIIIRERKPDPIHPETAQYTSRDGATIKRISSKFAINNTII
jgi:hypothetical protein